jgi:hypothetical protein
MIGVAQTLVCGYARNRQIKIVLANRGKELGGWLNRSNNGKRKRVT